MHFSLTSENNPEPINTNLLITYSFPFSEKQRKQFDWWREMYDHPYSTNEINVSRALGL